MSVLEALDAKFHAVVAEAEALGHSGLDELRALWARITGDVPKLEAEAVADGEEVVHDGETAIAPVVAEAKADASALVHEAEADVQAAVTDTPAAPPATS